MNPQHPNHPLDRHEQDLNLLLHALSSVQPGEDLAQRTLRAVEARHAVRTRQTTQSILTRWPRLALAGALATALALAFAISTHRARSKAVAPVVTSAAPAQQRLRPPAPVVPHVISHADASPPRSAAGFIPPAPRLALVSAQPQPQQGDPAYAPSLLAPPLPLTQQERLLIRATRHEASTELALLNFDELQKREAVDTAQFNQFFPPPESPPDNGQPVAQPNAQPIAPPTENTPGDSK